jgi:hypothetical protein
MLPAELWAVVCSYCSQLPVPHNIHALSALACTCRLLAVETQRLQLLQQVRQCVPGVGPAWTLSLGDMKLLMCTASDPIYLPSRFLVAGFNSQGQPDLHYTSFFLNGISFWNRMMWLDELHCYSRASDLMYKGMQFAVASDNCYQVTQQRWWHVSPARRLYWDESKTSFTFQNSEERGRALSVAPPLLLFTWSRAELDHFRRKYTLHDICDLVSYVVLYRLYGASWVVRIVHKGQTDSFLTHHSVTVHICSHTGAVTFLH